MKDKKIELKIKGDLIISYGSENVTLNKGTQHIILPNKDMAFIVQSVLKNLPLKINIEE
jgi:hypothetical protein